MVFREVPFPLSVGWEKHAAGLFFKTGNNVTIDAVRIVPDDGVGGHLIVYRTHHNDEDDPYWCDFAVFGVACDDDNNEPVFNGDGPGERFTELKLDHADANGFCKWDGCREIRNGVHLCDDDGFEAYLDVLRVAVRGALKRACER